jgi:hypothetical protein
LLGTPYLIKKESEGNPLQKKYFITNKQRCKHRPLYSAQERPAGQDNTFGFYSKKCYSPRSMKRVFAFVGKNVIRAIMKCVEVLKSKNTSYVVSFNDRNCTKM